MSFAWPHLLWLLFVPAAWLGWELTHRRRSEASAHPKILRAQAGVHSVDLLPVTPSGSLRSRSRVWLTMGIALSILALARPQWGRLEEPVFDQSREILLAIDLSRSMLTPDVKPSRLERGKLLIQSLLEKLEGERVGLVVFSGTAFLQCPMSADYEILREFLPNLGPDFLPEGGSNYGALLDTVLTSFRTSSSADRFLIVLSDGEATDEGWRSRLDELKKKGIRVIGLGVGTSAGGMIPDGSGGFSKDDRGAVVLSKLESATLQELATATTGIYRDASGWVDLAGLLKQTVEAGQKGKFVEKNTVRLAERFQWPLALGLWCLLVSFCYEFPVKPRLREVKLTSGTEPKTPIPPASPAAALAVLLLISHLGFPGSARALEAVPPPPPPPAPPSAQLSKMVGRLSTAESRSARDWAEFARETVTWGQRLQSEQQPVPEGPVRDALSAVELGAPADPKTTDWPKLREELEALLKQSEEKKNDQQQQQDKQEQQQQNQDQKNPDQQKQDQQKQDSQPSEDKPDKPQKEENAQPPKENNEPQKSPESAFGDMKEKPEPPPPPQGDTQKVGGAPEKRPNDPAAADPALAQPLQKLQQLRNEDSPAKLFQLMEGERKPQPNKKGKDW